MSLWRALNGAELVIGDEDLGLVFIWYGGAQVNIYDERFREVDMFSMGEAFNRKLTPRQVRAAINAQRIEIKKEDGL